MKIPGSSVPSEARSAVASRAAPTPSVPSPPTSKEPTEPPGYSALRAQASAAGLGHGGRPLNDPRLIASEVIQQSPLSKAQRKLETLAENNGKLEAGTSVFGRLVAGISSKFGEQASVKLSGPELLSIMASAPDLAKIDGVVITYDDNVHGLHTPNTEKHQVFVSSRVLMDERYPRYLDDQSAANRLKPETGDAAALVAQRFVGKDKINLLQIEAVRNLNAKRAEFETLPKVANPKSLPDGAPVSVQFVDMFGHHQEGNYGGLKEGFAQHEQGEIVHMAGEPFVALEDGRVLRMNHQLFEVRSREGAPSADREKLLDRAFAQYGATWGHNNNGGGGGATHTFERGKGVSAEVLNDLRGLIEKGNPYLLSGIVIRYFDEATQGSKLATYAIGDLKSSALTKDGFELPGLPLIKYTDVLGLKGRAGDSYGHLMATMEA